jgi:glycosyltransferase involved in cell wall biosynthesis
MLNKKLKVLVLGSCNLQHFPIIDYGGIESCVEHLCTGLYNHFKDEVSFSVIVPKILEKREITKKFGFNIVEANYIGCSQSGIHPINFAHEAKQIISSSPVKPDIIWAQGDWSAKGLYDLGIPVISTIHDSGPWQDGKYIYENNIYYRFVSKFLYEFVTEQHNIRHDVNLIRSKSFWVHSGLDDYEFVFEKEKENYILWVAGLHWGMEGKGLTTFIELAKRLPEENFVAYGMGDNKIADFLKQLSRELSNFDFRGKLYRDERHTEAFKKAKLFAMFSKIPEAFGRTGLEAISKGTPVIGSTYGSVPEQICDENIGICSDNIDEIVSYIKNKKFDYKKCYDTALEKYHVKTEIKNMLDISYKIINKK